jgi:hypothetical protein
MPMNNAIVTDTGRPVLALYRTKCAVHDVNLAPNSVFAAGTVLGQVGPAAVNDVQTVTITGAPTAGTFTLVNPATGAASAAIAFNATAAAVQGALTAPAMFGTGNVTVTGAGSGPYTVTFVGAYAAMPMAPLTLGTNALGGGTTPGVTIAHTTTGRTGGTYAAYAAGNTDGSQNAKAILKYPCATDAYGNVTLGTTAGGGEWGQAYSYAQVYFTGFFRCQDLVGLDAGAATALGGLVSGTVTNGILEVSR